MEMVYNIINVHYMNYIDYFQLHVSQVIPTFREYPILFLFSFLAIALQFYLCTFKIKKGIEYVLSLLMTASIVFPWLICCNILSEEEMLKIEDDMFTPYGFARMTFVFSLYFIHLIIGFVVSWVYKYRNTDHIEKLSD